MIGIRRSHFDSSASIRSRYPRQFPVTPFFFPCVLPWNSRTTMHRVLVIFAGAALGFASIATAIGFVIDAPHLLGLHVHHAETTGRVVRVIPNSHGRTEIEYSVRGAPYKRDVPFYWVPIPHSEGEALRVYYDPSDPSVASAVPAAEILTGQLRSWIGGSLLGSIFGAGAALNIIRYRDRHDARFS